jgi:hypothetical protein
VLEEIGYSRDELDQMVADGVILAPEVVAQGSAA